MSKRRVRLGSGLDPQKLADTIQQTFDAFADAPGLSLDAHQVEDGWLHLMPRVSLDIDGNPTRVIGWLLTFGYPHLADPLSQLAELKVALPEKAKLAGWEPELYATLWLPPDLPFDALAALLISLSRQVQGVTDDSHLEIALEFGQ